MYREPIAQAQVWSECASEWGQGSGFKGRVLGQVEKWFEGQTDLKGRLEDIVNALWEQAVIAPLLRLSQENAPGVSVEFSNNVIPLRARVSA